MHALQQDVRATLVTTSAALSLWVLVSMLEAEWSIIIPTRGGSAGPRH